MRTNIGKHGFISLAPAFLTLLSLWIVSGASAAAAGIPFRGIPSGYPSSEGTLRDRLDRAVRMQVEQGFRRAGLSGEIAAVHIPALVDQLPADATFQPARIFDPRKSGGKQLIQMRVTLPGEPAMRLNIMVECVAVIHGWVARESLRRGTTLKSEDFQRQTLRVIRRERDYFTGEQLPEGYRLSANLPKGEFIHFRFLELVPAVSAGDLVTIHFKHDNLTLVSPGKVRRNGQIGDVIPVVATVTGKRFRGRLVSPELVIVE